MVCGGMNSEENDENHCNNKFIRNGVYDDWLSVIVGK